MTYYTACLGYDDTRRFVRGAGTGATPEESITRASENSCHAGGTYIQYVHINRAQYLAIMAGDTSAERL